MREPWEIQEVLYMKIREFRVQAWDRFGTKILDSRLRDRVAMLQNLEHQTSRTDLEVASIKIDIKIVDQNDT
jgi:hypothetical protein